MNKADEFIDALQNCDLVKRLQTLKSVFESDLRYQKFYADFLNFQKTLVRISTNLQSLEPNEYGKIWRDKLELMQSDPLILEYLDLLYSLNDLIQKVQNIINDSLTINI